MTEEISQFNEVMKTAAMESIVEAISTMFSANPKIAEKAILCSGECEVISTIGFAGRLEGNVDLLLTQKDAMKIVSLMLGMELTEMSRDVYDGVGELLNVIAGGVKTRLDKAGYHFDITIPTAVNGEKLQIISSSEVKTFKFEVPGPDFCCGIILVYKLHEESKTPSKFLARKAPAKSSEDLLKDILNQNNPQ